MGTGLESTLETGITRFRNKEDVGTYPGPEGQFAMVLSPDEQWICIQGTSELRLFSTTELTSRTVPMTDYTHQGGINFTRDSRFVVVIGTQHIYSVDVDDLTVRTFDLPPEANNQPLAYTLSSGAYKTQSK